MTRRDIASLYSVDSEIFGVRVQYLDLMPFLNILGDDFRWLSVTSSSGRRADNISEVDLSNYLRREEDGENMCIIFFSGREINFYCDTDVTNAGYSVFDLHPDLLDMMYPSRHETPVSIPSEALMLMMQ